MKQLIFLFFFFLSFSLSAQQDWDLFPLHQSTWFSRGDSISQYYNDSIIVNGNETLHLFGAKYLYAAFGECTDEIIPEFWEHEALNFDLKVDSLYSNGDFYFLKINDDTLKFEHLATVGESWNIPTATNDTFRLTCSDLVEVDIFGFVDSLKSFEIQFIQNGNETPHPLNGQEFLLSKQSGFTQFFSLSDLYFSSEMSSSRILQGMKKEEASYGYTSTFDEFFHYEIGDILKWHEYDRSSPEADFNLKEDWFIDTITAINVVNNLLQLSVNRTIYTEISENGVLVNNFTEVGIPAVFSISSVVMDSLLNSPAQHPVGIYQDLRYLSRPAKINDLGISRTADFIELQDFSLIDCSSSPSNQPAGKFIINTSLGITNNFLDRGEDGNLFLEILGYKSGDFMWGELDELPIISSIEESSESTFEVYPNPANKVIHIGFPQDVNKVEISVYNLQGQFMMQKEIENGETILVENLAEGLYLLEIKEENRIHQKKIYVKR
jgi:hypothetical protein